MNEVKEQLHAAGVHIDCKLADRWAGSKRSRDGTWRRCLLAGRIERFHTHDYDGPLVCGCSDFA